MGQQVNPLIFRSKNFPYYINVWNTSKPISKKVKYFVNMEKLAEQNKQLNILHIQANYHPDEYCLYNIILYSKSTYSKNIKFINKYFLRFIKKNYSNNTIFGVKFIVLKHPLLSTHFLLRYIYTKLTSTKSSLRKVIPQLVVLIKKKYKIKGFKCIVSGRINGVQLAKTETFKFNETSLQNKTSYIKYNSISIPTKYGLLGIKIWLFFT